MNNQKPLEFSAGALDYFILTIISVVLIYIPFLGWAFLVNYSGGWFADRALVTGKKIEFKAGYGESLKFVAINAVLLVITLGIYSFWFYPKLYKYMAEHTQFVGEVTAAPVAPEPVVAAAEPIAPATVESVAPVSTSVDGVTAPEPEQPATPTAPQV